MVTFTVNDRKIEAEEGTSLLKACLDNGIDIPNLCYLEEMDHPPASCRICFVEVEGEDGPVTSCTYRVREGIIVKTETEEVRRLRVMAFELIMSNHQIQKDCCAQGKCSLQNIVKTYKIPIKPKRLKKLEKDVAPEEHPFLICEHMRCILCGKCIFTCEKVQGRPYLNFAKRGFTTFISFYGETDPGSIPCDSCYACVDICPVTALIKKQG